MSDPPRPPPFLAARHPSATDYSKSSSDSGNGGNPDPMPPGRSKRTLIESACAACRRRKSKCDGGRPSCSRCQTLRTDCAYEAEEGESRWSALRRRNQILETERAEVRELMTMMQTATEGEALEIFNRIRGGGYEDVLNILRQAREGELPPSPVHQSFSNEQRLPPIRTMFEITDAARPPPAMPGPVVVPRFMPQESGSSGYVSMSPYGRGSQSPPELPPSTAGA
ncbi:hypothetical protein LTR85_011240 [Meristemomyces frigidus]|nr:hypothetical protein LTR85_011240 [Meristemomyces frigidus]